MPILELDNVSLSLKSARSYGFNIKRSLVNLLTLQNNSDKSITILKNISLTLSDGDRLALIGPNGSGKTTFLRLLSGIYSPTSGSLKGSFFYPIIDRSLLVSHDLTAEHAIKAHYLYANHNLTESNTTLTFSQYRHNVIDISGLRGSLNKQIKFFSEGMRTRLVFALFISSPPTANIAIDEGFSTGDKNFTDKANSMLKDFLHNAGSLVFASHDDALLKEFCTHGLVFQNGSIIFHGDVNSALSYYHTYC